MNRLAPFLLSLRPGWLHIHSSCLFCGGQTASRLSLCHGCETDLPWLGSQCSVCAIPLATQGLACGACLKKPPAFERVEAPWRYGFPLDSAINRFKHRRQWPLGRLLADLQARHLLHAFDEGAPRPSLLIPVPLTKKRQRQRGYNQAAMLAHWIGKPLGIPIADQALQRTQDTPAQQGLDAAQRWRNLREAFEVHDAKVIRNRHIALVDDVLTTGATAEALARLLRREGALRVDVYCLARTPRPGD
ncbi:ComF family protein [Pseudomonas duriflava]|uniref:ComF family protein n=1 Tax=Pseudomonas duriflava TaxID=459528 RepID=A0A562QJ11_9PSED|nr:ComF family protein [Pseudomonas duriflava]TWI56747.1 ComF family protein [Pseudomonas duriflava]